MIICEQIKGSLIGLPNVFKVQNISIEQFPIEAIQNNLTIRKKSNVQKHVSKYPEQGESSSRVNIIDLSPPNTHTYTHTRKKREKKCLFKKINTLHSYVDMYVCHIKVYNYWKRARWRRRRGEKVIANNSYVFVMYVT